MTHSWRDMVWVFGRIGLMSFGGPGAQIAVMHRELVEDRPWLTEQEYLNALSFCMLLPGPEAMQLTTYAGWKMRGTAGGVLAGLLFVIPGAVVMLALAAAYAIWGQLPVTEALFLGIKAAIVIVVIEALLRVAKKALQSRDRWVIAGLSFLGIFFFSVPFPVIILLAGLYGYLTERGEADATETTASNPKTFRTVVLWGALWWAPVLVAWLVGAEQLTEIGLFFSKLAIVTFGGAYAVLAYMAQEVVSDFGWLTTAEMVDGLGLAETTPGPLILVTEYVGYLAGYSAGGHLAGFIAALMTLWVTFIPCFLWIFAGAPYLQWISAQPRLAGALSGITAAVVGVILNLSIWFALHIFFAVLNPVEVGIFSTLLPDFQSLNWQALILAILAAFLLIFRKTSLPLTLLICAIAGFAIRMLF